MAMAEIKIPFPMVHVALVDQSQADRASRRAFHSMTIPFVPSHGDRLWSDDETRCWEVLRREGANAWGRYELEERLTPSVTVVVREVQRS